MSFNNKKLMGGRLFLEGTSSKEDQQKRRHEEEEEEQDLFSSKKQATESIDNGPLVPTAAANMNIGKGSDDASHEVGNSMTTASSFSKLTEGHPQHIIKLENDNSSDVSFHQPATYGINKEEQKVDPPSFMSMGHQEDHLISKDGEEFMVMGAPPHHYLKRVNDRMPFMPQTAFRNIDISGILSSLRELQDLTTFDAGNSSISSLGTEANNTSSGGNPPEASKMGADGSVSKKNDEKKESKAGNNNFPVNVKCMLSTGIFDGVPVKYVSWSREKSLRGVIRGSGYLCGCNDCKFSKVLTGYEFERHANCKTKHPNNHIYFENGKTVYAAVHELKNTPPEMLFQAIQTVCASPINQKNFRAWKASYQAANVELQRIYGKDEAVVKSQP